MKLKTIEAYNAVIEAGLIIEETRKEFYTYTGVVPCKGDLPQSRYNSQKGHFEIPTGRHGPFETLEEAVAWCQGRLSV
jgi:hypothetical protein